jgi:peptidyl-prolyl cis-trans isomerase SurA
MIMKQMRVSRPISALAAIAALSLTTACQKPAAPAAAPKTVAPDVWAAVDGHDIHQDLVEKAYRSAVDPAATPAPTAEQVLTMKVNVIDELITQEVLLARAHARGLDATDADVDAAYNERKSGVADDAFAAQLKERGFTANEFKDGIRRELSVQKVLDADVNDKVTITDQQVAAFYEQNRAQFNLKEPQYRLAQIIVTAAKDPQTRNRMNDDAGTLDEAARKVAMIVERLKAGADFGTLAMDYSEDPQSAEQGGDLGFVPASALSRVAPQLRDAVLKMEPGHVSTVTVGQVHTILALVSKEPAGQRSLDTPTVRESIRDLLKSRQQELMRTAYIAAARADAKVTNYLAQRILSGEVR